MTAPINQACQMRRSGKFELFQVRTSTHFGQGCAFLEKSYACYISACMQVLDNENIESVLRLATSAAPTKLTPVTHDVHCSTASYKCNIHQKKHQHTHASNRHCTHQNNDNCNSFHNDALFSQGVDPPVAIVILIWSLHVTCTYHAKNIWTMAATIEMIHQESTTLN